MKGETQDIDLHKLLKGRVYDHALLSTFTFNPRFFEEYMLERFKALQGKGGVTVFLDRGQYEEIIEATASGRNWVPKLANRRYLLQPVSVPGVFHPKVFLFTTAKRGLLIIGSANFTQDGLGGNAELVSVFEYRADKKEEALPLFQFAFSFFEELSDRWASDEGASKIDEMRRAAPWLLQPLETAKSESLPILLHNLDTPLWPQITDGLGKVTEISVVSRFFDDKPAILDKLCEGIGDPKIKIHTQSKRGTLTPDWLKHEFHSSKRLSIHLCEYGDGEHPQPLHGKAYALKFGRKTRLAVGSANFSTPALMRPAESGNVEVMLLFPEIPSGSFDPIALFDPLDTAKKVTHPDQLQMPEDVDKGPANMAQRFSAVLEEARLDESDLLVMSSTDEPGLACRLSRANIAPHVIPMKKALNGIARIELPTRWVRRITDSPSIAQLVKRKGDKWEPVSNPVLVAALFDPDTGKDARQTRRLREAIESPKRFMGVLRELCEGDNEAALMSFLANCNIPFDVSLKTFNPKRGRATSEGGQPMEFSHLGSRNLRHFEQLHDAAMAFAQRHRKRLARHVENGTAKGIPNFLHILETLILLLASQIERAKEGLLAEPETTLKVDEWKRFRVNLAEYYQELVKLLELTVRDYLPTLLENETRQAVHDGFGDSTESLLASCVRAINARQEIGKAMQGRIFVETALGTKERAQFHNSVLVDAKWKQYYFRLKQLADDWRKQTAA